MNRIFRNFTIAMISFLLSFMPFFGDATNTCEPKFTGTFLQSWLCYGWDDARWHTEFDNMREAGIEYLIIQCTAEQKTDGSKGCDYDSSLSALTGCWNGVAVIENALFYAKEYGIKLFIGLANYDNWWTDYGNSDEYTGICRLSADMAQEIYSLYHYEYGDTLYGWYFVPEINNSMMFRMNIENIAAGVNLLASSLSANTPGMPLMLSPFLSDYAENDSAAAMIYLWSTFFENAGLRDGDIFAPQDSIGGSTENYLLRDSRWRMYAATVKSADKDIRLWANCECFSSGRNVFGAPQKDAEIKNLSQTLDRFCEQLGSASRYVENIITFSYNHYMSPALVNCVFHDTYIDYVNNGFVLENTPPSAPKTIRMAQTDGGTLISWEPSVDNIGIAYYQIFRNGVFLSNIEAKQDCVPTEYLDTQVLCDKNTYTVIAVDGAGNASDSKIFNCGC